MVTKIVIDGREITNPVTKFLILLGIAIIFALIGALVVFVLLPLLGIRGHGRRGNRAGAGIHRIWQGRRSHGISPVQTIPKVNSRKKFIHWSAVGRTDAWVSRSVTGIHLSCMICP